jgi:hypothetical protein
MKIEPLFIRLANRKIGALEVAQSVISSSKDEPSIKIASQAITNLPDISLFIKDFREVLSDLIDNGVNQRVINYINSYMKPSLSEIVDSSGNSRSGENRWVFIKNPDAPWVEAIVCYNLSLYIKAFGFDKIKSCPVCSKFFTHKGKYAKYCSDSCKSQGS